MSPQNSSRVLVVGGTGPTDHVVHLGDRSQGGLQAPVGRHGLTERRSWQAARLHQQIAFVELRHELRAELREERERSRERETLNRDGEPAPTQDQRERGA